MSDERARIRPCTDADLEAMVAVVNAAATAYAGVIPADRYHEPYMPREELCAEIAAGVRFWGLFEAHDSRDRSQRATARRSRASWASRTSTT